MYDNKIITVNIRNARMFRNYSQDYLALKLNISQNAYSKIELGQTKLSLERFLHIAEILKVNPVELITKGKAFTPVLVK